MDKLLIVGTGSVTEEVVSFVERYELFDIVGFSVDSVFIKTDEYMGKPVFPLEELEKFIDINEMRLFIAVSWYQRLNSLKTEMYKRLKARGFLFANLISPKATVLCREIGEGNWIDDHSYLAFDSAVGSNNTFRHYSYVAHHVKIGDHNLIGARSSIGGSTKIGNQNYIGISATLFNKLNIGNKCVVGGGCVVKRNLPNYSLCVNTNTIVKQKTEDEIVRYISLEQIEKTIRKDK